MVLPDFCCTARNNDQDTLGHDQRPLVWLKVAGLRIAALRAVYKKPVQQENQNDPVGSLAGCGSRVRRGRLGSNPPPGFGVGPRVS
jgi:hypothetical protein